MNEGQLSVIRECATRSLKGEMNFAQVVGKLTSIAVERYHADYTRSETTYYLHSGESAVLPIDHPAIPIAEAFSPQAIEAAIRQSQRGEIDYRQFLELSMAAGCVGYFVQLTGRRVLYFGRAGDFHLEPFPK